MIFLAKGKDYHFQEESFSEALGELIDIMIRNHKETGIYPQALRPDFERMVALESSNNLVLMSVRLEDKIVGYSVFFLDSEIYQCDVVSATQSTTFVDKEHRGIGLAFIKFCDDILKKRGINSVWRQASGKLDIGKVYEYLGYKFIEKSYLRRL
jgi:GNAT superfamily N-acetyltransferase